MLQGWIVVLIALAYIGFLFLVASYGDRMRAGGRDAASRLWIYPLSLAIYCTSWTFFGSVGLASRGGFDFLAIYIGPMLMVGLGYPLFARMVRLAKKQNITSIADLIAARYGKSQAVAATVALIAIIGMIPYIALQLKAVSSSVGTIMMQAAPGGQLQPMLGDSALLIALFMAVFAVLFGTRHTDATEHQDGLMLAIATELIVKLVAFLAVGVFVTFVLYPGPLALFGRALQNPEIAKVITQLPPLANFCAMAVLSLFAIVLLPRQFHVSVVENRSEAEIRRAAWLFPAYLVLINLFVVPIAIAGLLDIHSSLYQGDMFVLALPLAAHSTLMTVIAFVGGLSAATAMVIVELVALAIMVSNDIVVPLLLQRRATRIGEANNAGARLLVTRRIAIFVILFLAYAYYRSAGDAQLASIGLLSFAAISQLAPAFFGGLIWRRGTARGAIAGMTAGVLVWAYTLLLPSIFDAGAGGAGILTDGPWGLAFLRPQALFGLDLPPLVQGVLLSLACNITCYIGFSLSRTPEAIERVQADLFVPSALAPMLVPRAPSFRLRRASISTGELIATVARYLGEERTRKSFENFAAARRISLDSQSEADIQLLQYGEYLLASAIGAASSRLVLSLLIRKRTLSTKAALKLLDDANAAIHYNREILQTALDHVRQGIAVFDKELSLVCWNRQFGELFDLPHELTSVGVTLGEILRSVARRSEHDDADLDAFIAERIAKYTADDAPFLERLANQALVIEVRANRMPDGGLVTTFTDITPSVQAAEALERANASLERRVRERTTELTRLNAELHRAKAEADEANVSKTRFVAAASHDILQPLNAARLYVTSLSERQRGSDDGDLIDNIDASLEAVEEIFGALLDISRLDTGAMKPEFSQFCIGEMLAAAGGGIRPARDREGPHAACHAVCASCAVGSPAARAALTESCLQCHQIHARRRRAGRLPAPRRASAHRRVRYRHRHPARQAPRGVQGISPARPGRARGARRGAWPVHRRTYRTRTRLRGVVAVGAGPRVAILRRAAVRRCHAWPAGARSETRYDAGRLAGTVVLCVDNDRAILDGMETLLGGWGCRVLKATDLTSAIAAMTADATTPDGLLVDYHLDGGNGVMVIAELRRRLLRHIPAIVITADRSAYVREEAARESAHLINKPIKPASLRALMTQWHVQRVAAE